MTDGQPSRRDLRRRPNRTKRVLTMGLITLTVLGALSFLNKGLVRNWFDVLAGNDYSGQGTDTAMVTINPGDIGEEVAKELVAKKITKAYPFTLNTMYSVNPTFFPGTYICHVHISATDAIKCITDPANQMTNKVIIREGLRIGKVFSLLAEKSGLPVADFEIAAARLSDYDLPKVAPSLEGYLYPATYSFDPNATAKQMLSAMITRTKEQLVADGVQKKDWHKVLTLASVIQMEARALPDFYKVSRVFKNRLAIGMHLQSDATVSYGVAGTTVSTSAADRSDPNGYNTYLFPGLPIGPISGAGATAIDAALHPADGSWIFFCAVNLETGETVFSTTIGEHERAVAQWRQWMRENPGWNG